MRIAVFLFASALVIACANEAENAAEYGDTPVIYMNPPDTSSPVADTGATVFSNERFQEVTIEKENDSTYRVRGKAQVFEASLSWVLRQGGNEVKSGYEQTNAGAPAFGKFSFTLQVPEPEARYSLLLFESSAKDGSRQHILEVPLYK